MQQTFANKKGSFKTLVTIKINQVTRETKGFKLGKDLEHYDYFRLIINQL